MCKTKLEVRYSPQPSSDAQIPTSDSITKSITLLRRREEERALARKCGWFCVRYFDQSEISVSRDAARYIFVNKSSYGIVWPNVAFFALMHACFIYALYLVFANWWLEQWLATVGVGVWSGIGISAGAHRLWSHKAYKASLFVRIILMVLFTMAGQNDLFTWVRDHRLHHKFTETDADPHNSRRGGFFAHVGWLLTKKHPDVIIKGATIDNSDLEADHVVHYNKKYYAILYLLLRVYVPAWLANVLCGSEMWICYLGTFAFYIGGLHTAWFVNSAAHIFGERPYNGTIQPRENIYVAVSAFGEGYHNYHHTFPFDYRIAENGFDWFNPAKWFIDLMAKINLVTDLKTASPDLINKTKAKVEASKISESQFYVNNHPYIEPHNYCLEK